MVKIMLMMVMTMMMVVMIPVLNDDSVCDDVDEQW